MLTQQPAHPLTATRRIGRSLRLPLKVAAVSRQQSTSDNGSSGRIRPSLSHQSGGGSWSFLFHVKQSCDPCLSRTASLACCGRRMREYNTACTDPAPTKKGESTWKIKDRAYVPIPESNQRAPTLCLIQAATLTAPKRRSRTYSRPILP